MNLLKITTFITILLLIPSLAITLSLNRYFLIYEYSRPTFPTDFFGFSAADRLDLASESLQFLTSWHSPNKAKSKLENISLPNSSQAVYTTNEISHLIDVKHYTDLIRLVLIISFTILITIISKSYRHSQKLLIFLRSSRVAAASLIAIIILVGGFAVFAWESFFIQFHQLLFPQGNWTFSIQSGLIRLFPQAFWVDYAVFLISLILITALTVLILTTLALHHQKDKLNTSPAIRSGSPKIKSK